MLSLFQRQPKKAVAPQAEPPRSEVAYDPALVAGLTQQHRDLVMLLVKADSLARQRRYEDVAAVLDQFKTALRLHVVRESTELHPYLVLHLTGVQSKDLLRQMRHEAVLAERAVEGLIEHYTGYPVSERNVLRFSAELEGVIEEFSTHVEHEEAAYYTLYQAPGLY